MSAPLPVEGTRFRLADYTGTIKYVGQVDNTTGVWLGVEWDDPKRGKHDGVKDSKRYFTCRIPNAGSFIRPTANISYGYSFLYALSSKYVEQLRGSESQERVVLGSSNGAIEVEAVDLDKIRAKFANLDRLREVSLDKESVSRYEEPPGSIRATCPNVRGLDLSLSLISSWDIISLICIELSALQRLSLNHTRLALPRDSLTLAFRNLIELRLNATLMTWQEMQQVTSEMPTLKTVEIGYNLIHELSTSIGGSSTIGTINLDSNDLHDWVHICNTLQPYLSLERIVLTSNKINTIPPPTNQTLCLEHVSLSHNRLTSWRDIDSLSAWCPQLSTLTLMGNPLFDDPENARIGRQLTIARIPTLTVLDAANISAKERTDCELFYLSYIVLHGPKSDDERAVIHPRWPALCQKHGRPDEARADQNPNKLSRRLMELNMYHLTTTPPSRNDINNLLADAQRITLRVLPTMTLRALRLKVCKTMKRDASSTAISLWLQMQDNSYAQLEDDRDAQDLGWLGIESGSNIIFTINE